MVPAIGWTGMFLTLFGMNMPAPYSPVAAYWASAVAANKTENPQANANFLVTA
jgi:hypothetical protein